MKRMLCLALLLWMRPGVAGAQTQPTPAAPKPAFQGQLLISTVNGQAVPGATAVVAPVSAAVAQRPMPPVATPDTRRVADVVLSPVIEVRGEVVGLEQKDVDSYLVQLLVYRLYDGNWVTVGSSSFEPQVRAEGRGKRRWVARDVRLPMPDHGRGFDLTAVLVRRERALPDGLVDYGTARQYAVAFSQLVRGDVGCGGDIELTHIRDVTGRSVRLSPGDENLPEVGWRADVRGRVNKPEGTFVFLTVHPATSDNKWVMEKKGELSGQYWSETGYFGEEGLHTGELFRLQAVISRTPLRLGSYTPDQWRMVEGGICATSGEVPVRRRIGPGDLVFRTVDQQEVAGGVVVPAGLECQVAGGIEDPRPEYALRQGESVWVLSRRVGGDEGWVVGALAVLMPDGLGWRVPSLKFSQPGQYQLTAVATTGLELPRRQLGDRDWYLLASDHALRRLSRMVAVNVGTPPAPAAPVFTPPPTPSNWWFWLITGLLVVLLIVVSYGLYADASRRRAQPTTPTRQERSAHGQRH